MSMSISISPIGSRVSKWGEGPIFWDDHLLYVDIEGHALIRLNPENKEEKVCCLLYTSPSPRDLSTSRMPSSA